MADRRRGKQRRREGDSEKPTKEEYAVAKHLRFNLPPREGKLVGMSVQYFIASKAVDMLLESKWGSSAKSGALFTSRNSCIDYCNNLLNKGIFHRAARVGKRKDRDVVKKKKKVKESEEEVKDAKEEEKKAKLEKRSKKKEKKKEKEDEEDTEKDKEKESEGEKEERKGEKKEDEKKDEEKRKKKKFKLEMHENQVFKDGEEIYVWIYDPVPFKTFVIGLLLVLGAIAVCMFPLWPPEVRLGIYYLSLAAAGFVGVILALCVIRLVLFCLVWGITFGRHHFWFLPNLTEDVGFFDSFRPLYKHDAVDRSKPEALTEKGEEKEDKEGEEEGKERKEGEKEEGEEKGSDKEGSGEGSEDNGYEIVDREEFLQKEEGEQEEDSQQEGEEEEEGEGEGEEEGEEQESKKTK